MGLNVIYNQGGMNEYARTGVYPRSLEVYDVSLNKRWRRKITEEKNSGDLKIGKHLIYKYNVNIEEDIVTISDLNNDPIENCLILIVLND